MALFMGVTPAIASAQSMADCGAPRPLTIGAAVGRSSPYFEPAGGISSESQPGSLLSRGGVAIAGRADVPIAGPWRARIEGAGTDWRLERQVYSADLRQVIATETVGHIKVRQVVALAGRQAGRSPVCAYVLAGAGLYSLSYRGTGWRKPGYALTAGLEFPAGPRGVVQVDVQLHLISAGGINPIGSSTVMDARLLAGWAYRF